MDTKSKKILLFILFVILMLVFTWFTYLVHRGIYNQFDFDATVKLQDHISRRWDLPFSIFSVLGSPEFSSLCWLVLFIFLLIKKFWLTAASSLLFFVGILAEVFGKIFIYHPGPPFMFFRSQIHFSFASNYVHTSYSYPSGHITRTAFIVTFLFIYLAFRTTPTKRVFLQSCLILFYIGMLISRIYLGEHWTTDVIGGILLGTSFGCLSALTIPFKKNQQLA